MKGYLRYWGQAISTTVAEETINTQKAGECISYTKDNILFELGALLDLLTVMGNKFLEEYGLNPDEQVFTEDNHMDCLENFLKVQAFKLCQWLHNSSPLTVWVRSHGKRSYCLAHWDGHIWGGYADKGSEAPEDARRTNKWKQQQDVGSLHPRSANASSPI